MPSHTPKERAKKLVRTVRVEALTRSGEESRSKSDPKMRKRIASKIRRIRKSTEGRKQIRLGIKTSRKARGEI